MMRLFIACLALCICAISTTAQQVQVMIIDNDTHRPVRNASIRINDSCCLCLQDNGVALIETRTLKDKIHLAVAARGYASDTVSLASSPSFYTIKLHRDYDQLEEVEIRRTKLNIDTLLTRVIKAIPSNYISSDAVLEFKYATYLHNAADTQLAAGARVYWQGGRKQDWLKYTRLIKGSDSLRFTTDKLNNELKGYVTEIISFPDNSFSSLIKHRIPSSNYRVVISTFYQDSTKFHDLLLIAKSDSKVKYGLKATLLGFGGRNNPNSGKKYITLTELHVNTKTLAVPYMQSLTVESSDKEREEFLQLQDRNKISQWIDKSMVTGKKFSSYKIVFEPSAENMLLAPSYTLYQDKLQHALYKGDSIGDYTYSIEYKNVGRETIGLGTTRPFTPERDMARRVQLRESATQSGTR